MASLPGFGIAPEGHLSYSAGPNGEYKLNRDLVR